MATVTMPITRGSIKTIQDERKKEGKDPYTVFQLANLMTISDIGQRMGLQPSQRHITRIEKCIQANELSVARNRLHRKTAAA